MIVARRSDFLRHGVIIVLVLYPLAIAVATTLIYFPLEGTRPEQWWLPEAEFFVFGFFFAILAVVGIFCLSLVVGIGVIHQDLDDSQEVPPSL